MGMGSDMADYMDYGLGSEMDYYYDGLGSEMYDYFEGLADDYADELIAADYADLLFYEGLDEYREEYEDMDRIVPEERSDVNNCKDKANGDKCTKSCRVKLQEVTITTVLVRKMERHVRRDVTARLAKR